MRVDGKRQALILLQSMPVSEQKKLLQQIRGKDPEMADFLEVNLVSFEDLKFLTTKMIQDVLRKISLEKIGLALRAGSEELKLHLKSNMSSSMGKDLDDILMGPPKRVSDVQNAQREIAEALKEMQDKGEIVIDRTGKGEEYV